MKKKVLLAILCGSLSMSLLTACGGEQETVTEEIATVEAVTEETVTEEVATVETVTEENVSEADQANEYYETGKAFLYGTGGNKVDYEAAYNNFQQAVELGNTDANFYLGVLYDWKSYPEQDFEKARAYYEAAGENPYAYVSLGFIHYYGQCGEVDKEKGKEYIEKAIALGCTDGYVALADIASSEEDYTTAMEYYTKVVEEGTEQLYVAVSMEGIAGLYRYGRGVEQDSAKAIEWNEKAAQAGLIDCYNYIGVMYAKGEGVEQDYAKAMEWIEKGAELGSIACMKNLVVLYYEGYVVEQDSAKVIEWYEKAAQAGLSDCYNYIGEMYQHGDGVEQDDEKAIEWYQKGAEQGNVTSMRRIANVYRNNQDGTKAIEWYEKAALAGDIDCYTFIGMMYESGEGVEQDEAKAMEWYEKAEAASANK